MTDNDAVQRPPPKAWAALDPGWLFLAAGLGILAASVLVPASEGLRRATWLRERAQLVEAHRQQRLARYEEYLAALDTQDPALVAALAESQLNQIPQSRDPVPGQFRSTRGTLAVFPALEPPPLVLPEYHESNSTLSRWTADPTSRMWLLLGGAVSVLIGLLPASRGRGDHAWVDLAPSSADSSRAAPVPAVNPDAQAH